jgi:rubrerythrin
MMSQVPTSNLEKLERSDLGNEILRAGMIAESDAINLYEQMSAMTSDSNIKKILSSITKEEKTHFGEFQTLLLKRDVEQMNELERAKKEIELMKVI